MGSSSTCSKEEENFKPKRDLFIVSLSLCLCFAAYQGVLGLESSMNVKEGLGTTSVLIIFIISAISCILVTPNMIDFFGAKAAITIGLVGFLAYVAANFYPSWYTLIPAAIFHGITESSPWAGSYVYINFLGEELWKRQKSPENGMTQDAFVIKNFGIFNAFIYLGNMLGNGLTSLILHAFPDEDIAQHSERNTTENVTAKQPLSKLELAKVENERLKKCGAADCQAEYIYNSTEEELETFNPSITSIYVLLGLFVFLSVVGILLQACATVKTKPKFAESEKKNLSEKEKNSKSNRLLQNLHTQLRDAFYHVVSTQRILLSPFYLYYGLTYGYFITEFTRAYVSCTMGVEKLGFSMMVFSVSAVISSIPGSRLVIRVGMKKCVLLVGIIHLGVYFLSLFWIPNESNLWVVYVIAAIGGFGEGTILNLTQGVIAVYFETKELGIAYSINNLTTNLGVVASTGWSTSLCVHTKIYIHIGCLVFAILCVLAADILHSKKQKKIKEIYSLPELKKSDSSSEVSATDTLI